MRPILYSVGITILVIHIQNVNTEPVKLNKCPGSHLPDEITLPSPLMSDREEAIFSLQSGNWKCFYGHGSEELIIRIPLKPVNRTIINGTIEGEDAEVDVGPLSTTGILEAQLHDNAGYYKPPDYCIQSLDEFELTLQVCKIRCGGDITCVPKCCPVFDEAFTLHPHVPCLSIGQQTWSPIMEYGQPSKSCLSSHNCLREDWAKQHIHYTFPTPCDDYHFHPSDSMPFQLLVNGSIRFSNSIIVYSDFCLDGILNDNGIFTAQMLAVCAKEETETEKTERKFVKLISLIYSGMMYMSSFFLLLTIVVYILIWDKHNLHGYTVFSHSVSMFCMLVFMGTSHLMSLFLDKDSSRSFGCIFVALLSHFFFLSTFCWLTMLNFDLWWTFKTLSPTIAKSKGLQRFIFYSLFAWGIPTLFISFAFIIDETHSTNGTTFPLARYGVDRCYIDTHAQGYYLYLPIGILLCVNLIFFGTTVYIMYKYQQSTRSAREGQSNHQSQSFQLFAKLFCVMGVTWIFEVISWGASNDKVSPGWIVFDMINLLQGIAIFIIFVCKRQVLSHLWNKYPRLRWCLAPITRLSFCKPTGMDVEGREASGSGGRTTQSNISMKNYSRSNSLSEA